MRDDDKDLEEEVETDAVMQCMETMQSLFESFGHLYIGAGSIALAGMVALALKDEVKKLNELLDDYCKDCPLEEMP